MENTATEDTSPVILLVDNGSSNPGATCRLRQIAHQLSQLSGRKIHPVSLQHADNIPDELIDNKPATIFKTFIDNRLKNGQRVFIVLPLFFGESKALTSLIPTLVDELKDKHGDFTAKISAPVYPLPEGEKLLEDILFDHAKKTSKANDNGTEFVLVDHGSPSPAVTQVRENIVKRLRRRLDDDNILEQAVMERRASKKYDFNGELLEDWLHRKALSGVTHINVLLLFFLPGRHAGKNGDIEAICKRAMEKHNGLIITISPLIGEHPALIQIMNMRLQSLLPT